MGDVAKQLKDALNPVFGGPRTPLEKKCLNYNRKVLVGEWFEETKIHESGNPVVCGGTGETLYQTDYMAPRPEPDAVQGSRNIVYDSAIRSLGQPASLADVGYSTNFATLYDLTFNRAAPELNRFCGEGLRKYKASARAYFPIRDYTNNFVGGVNKGLLDCKKDEWKCDSDPEKGMYQTTTSEDFTPKVADALAIAERIGRRKLNGSNYGHDMAHVQIRERDSRGDAVSNCLEHPEVCWSESRYPKNILPGL